MSKLLAVDIGLKTGLALYGSDGRLLWYRSKNYGSNARLKRDVFNMLGNIDKLAHVVIEGGGDLALIWEREAQRKKIPLTQISAEKWRKKLLYPREQHSGLEAKHNADELARRVIKWSGLSASKSLRHDAAEAILTGLWCVLELGWLEEFPFRK